MTSPRAQRSIARNPIGRGAVVARHERGNPSVSGGPMRVVPTSHVNTRGTACQRRSACTSGRGRRRFPLPGAIQDRLPCARQPNHAALWGSSHPIAPVSPPDSHGSSTLPGCPPAERNRQGKGKACCRLRCFINHSLVTLRPVAGPLVMRVGVMATYWGPLLYLCHPAPQRRRRTSGFVHLHNLTDHRSESTGPLTKPRHLLGSFLFRVPMLPGQAVARGYVHC